MIFLLVAIVAYLLGSIPFGYVLVRVFHGKDIRKSGSGNIGATNVARSSRALGLLTLLLDAGKGSAAVMTAFWMVSRNALTHTVLVAEPDQIDAARKLAEPFHQHAFLVAMTAALFAIIGHLYPVWLKFRGGKGVATALGALALIAPKSILCVIAIFVILFSLFRYVSLSSVIAISCFPVAAWIFHEYGNQPIVLVMMTCASGLVIWKHRRNLHRLWDGTEPKFGRPA